MQKGNSGHSKNKHSCFILQYHLVLVTKYKKKIITGDLETALKSYSYTYFKERGLPILAMEMMRIIYYSKPRRKY